MIYAIAVVLVLILDQGVKYWTVSHIALNTGIKEFIPHLLRITYVRNFGAAFSILQNTRWLLVGLTVVFAAVVIYALATNKIHGALGRWSAVFILAGALGNGIDRAFIGYVVDMLEPDFLIFGWQFPVFNVADMFVVVFGILFCCYIIFSQSPDELPETKPERERKPLRDRFKHEGEPEEEEDRRGGNIEMIRKASVRTQNEPKPVYTEPPKARTAPVKTAPPVFDPANPFSEWENVLKKTEPEPYIPAAKPAPAMSYTAPVKPEAPKPAEPVMDIPKTTIEHEIVKVDGMEFDIDDILAEFKD